MSIERELGQVQQALANLAKGQDALDTLIRHYGEEAKDSLQRHEDKDDEEFEKLREETIALGKQMAKYGGAFAILVTLAELFLKH